MAYIEIINNSEKYIELLQQKDKIYIHYADIKPSDDLIKTYNPLWGYYGVKTFINDNKYVSTKEVFLNCELLCGDFLFGEGFLKKMYTHS